MDIRRGHSVVSISQSRYFSFQVQYYDYQGMINVYVFQSRNRDTFLFKSLSFSILRIRFGMFQSRNRDTFLFKCSRTSPIASPRQCFNLAIEILFFSSCQHRQTSQCRMVFSFNLAIEILFFSRRKEHLVKKERTSWYPAYTCEFQSRNRDTFLFKYLQVITEQGERDEFQSRNRDTFLFKPLTHIASPGGCDIIVSILTIEILFFSRSTVSRSPPDNLSLFQSRNRDTFLFKQHTIVRGRDSTCKFQSRNRDTFLFKQRLIVQAYAYN